jgi:hypothetical protein
MMRSTIRETDVALIGAKVPNSAWFWRGAGKKKA